MSGQSRYWFPAKRYGWGWGLPNSWQGWLVLGVYAALMLLGPFLFPPKSDLAAYLAYVIGLGVLLVGVCWRKGEPPHWRWGNEARR